jgi:YegS/Rv2252/BmrU family lipid kinase
MSIALVWNPGAGSANEDTLRTIKAHFADCHVFQCGDDCNPVACARDAIASGADTIIAAGGDGTVSAVASQLLGTNRRLGVIALGTSNSFAAALDIPTDLADALALITAASTRTIDAAEVTTTEGTRRMVLHCMIGVHAETIAATPTEAKKRWGVLAYLASAVKHLISPSSFSTDLTTPDQRIHCTAIAVGVANLAPAKTVLAQGPSHVPADDGKLQITIVAAESFTEVVATSLHLLRTARAGEAADRDNVGSLSSPHVDITTTPPQQVLLDGEPFGTTPVQAKILPRALVVIAPPPATTDVPVNAPLEGLPDLQVESR